MQLRNREPEAAGNSLCSLNGVTMVVLKGDC